MNKDRQDEIFEKFPNWFGDRFNQFGRYIEIGDGWLPLFEEFLSNIETLSLPHNFSFCQVKQKFGGLRIYTEPYVEKVEEYILIAEGKAVDTCEICGQAGRIRNSGWITTLCDKHAEEKQV